MTTNRKATALRLPIDILVWAKKYARTKNISLTQLIINYLTDLRSQNEDTHVDQI